MNNYVTVKLMAENRTRVFDINDHDAPGALRIPEETKRRWNRAGICIAWFDGVLHRNRVIDIEAVPLAAEDIVPDTPLEPKRVIRPGGDPGAALRATRY